MLYAQVKGGPEVLARLERIERRAAGRAIRRGTREGAKVFLRRARARIRRRTGLSSRLLTVRASRARRGRAGHRVVFRSPELLVKETKGGKRFFYPALVEYFHEPFMRPAFDEGKDEAGETARKVIAQEIAEEAAR